MASISILIGYGPSPAIVLKNHVFHQVHKMASNYLVSVSKLKGRENYDVWAFAAENVLILEGLEKCIKDTTNESQASDTSSEDLKAKAKLILTINSSLYVHIKEAKNTRELWIKLKTMFDDSGFTRRISLLRSLIST